MGLTVKLTGREHHECKLYHGLKMEMFLDAPRACFAACFVFITFGILLKEYLVQRNLSTIASVWMLPKEELLPPFLK